VRQTQGETNETVAAFREIRQIFDYLSFCGCNSSGGDGDNSSSYIIILWYLMDILL
jgi:hypothetical protein